MIISNDKALELNMGKFTAKDLTYWNHNIILSDIENHITKDLYIFNLDKNINEFLKEYDLITKMKIKYILIKNKSNLLQSEYAQNSEFRFSQHVINNFQALINK